MLLKYADVGSSNFKEMFLELQSWRYLDNFVNFLRVLCQYLNIQVL